MNSRSSFSYDGVVSEAEDSDFDVPLETLKKKYNSYKPCSMKLPKLLHSLKSALERKLEENEARRPMFSRVGITKKRIAYESMRGGRKYKFVTVARAIPKGKKSPFHESFNFIPFAVFARITKTLIKEIEPLMRITEKTILILREHVTNYTLEHMAAGLYVSQLRKKKIVVGKDVKAPFSICGLLSIKPSPLQSDL